MNSSVPIAGVPAVSPPPPESAGASTRRGAPLYLAWTAFQRRQVSMADLVGFECVFLPLKYKGPNHLWRAWHYAVLALRTLAVLRARRPAEVWLQLPQMPLLWAVLLYRILFAPGLRVVADCHNAVFRPPWSKLPFGVAALARCDLVLVHNTSVLEEALALGLPAARTRVLEDVPPAPWERPVRPVPACFAGQPHPWVLVAGSYGRDEPVAEVLQAARQLDGGVVAITGRLSNAARNGHDLSQRPPNVVLTDYVSVADFDNLLIHCDVVLGLTRHDGIQLSVCNEALGFGRPLVMSGTPLLRALFGSGAIAVDSSDPDAIAAGIQRACEEPAHWAAASAALAQKRREEWRTRALQECLALLGRATRPEPAGRPGQPGQAGRPGAASQP